MNKINIPDIEIIKKKIREWVRNYPRITKVYLFGSYVKRHKPVIEDIDIAIEISEDRNDTAFGFWCGEASKMEKELAEVINYTVDLGWFNGERTKIIKKGLEEGNVLIYEKK